MTWVKICGITNLGDALTAVDAGADAVGFVFYEKSPRYIDRDAARTIAQRLPQKTEKIGVFVEMPSDPADFITDVGLTGIQARLGTQAKASQDKSGASRQMRTVVTLSVSRFLQDEKRLQGLIAEFLRLAESPKRPNGLDTFLLDSSTPDRPGGTGQTFNWKKVAPLVQVMSRSAKVIVAGGLTPANVGEAMRMLRPWGVDVATGVESSPGKKDLDKVRQFVSAVRDADRKMATR